MQVQEQHPHQWAPFQIAGGNLNEMSKPIFWDIKKHIIIFSSAELAQKVVKVKEITVFTLNIGTLSYNICLNFNSTFNSTFVDVSKYSTSVDVS